MVVAHLCRFRGSHLWPALQFPGDGAHGEVMLPCQAPGSGAMPDFGSPEEGAKQLPEVEAAVRAMETSLGERHPKVRFRFPLGTSWMLLVMYKAEDQVHNDAR